MATSPSSAPYQVIARRYRPQTFSEVVGQQAVVHMLHNEIRENRIGHGYLFCGPRGTGKTSMARIFAKAINCVNGPTTEPCGKCSHCQEIAAGNHLDVIELDAATYTKVETMRDLLDGLARSPFSARKKVYIIDEVHMLSNSSFNALLKSLEEPPSHVVFILATTNPEKIPETVISRCRRCNFDRIGMKETIACLGRIMEKEGLTVDAEERAAVLGAIALASDGGLRDAQVLLDQLISLSEGELKLETVRSLLGVVESDLFLRLLKALVDRDTVDSLVIVGDLVDRGRDLQRFVKMFQGFLRDAMILRAGGSKQLARLVDPDAPEFRALLERTTLPFLLNAVQQFFDLEDKMRGAAPPRFLLEFTLIKLTAIDPKLVIDSAYGGLPTPPPGGGGGKGGHSANVSAVPRASASATPAERPPMQAPLAADSLAREQAIAPPPAIEEIPTTDTERWAAFVDHVSAANPTIRGVIRKARLREVQPSKIVIELAASDAAMRPLMDRPEIVRALRDAGLEAWKRPLFPVFTVAEPESLERVAQPIDDDLVSDVESYDSAPAAPPAQQTPAPAQSETMTLAEALEEYPDFKAACELVERHFGIKPTAFNDKRLDVG
ncbi:MAG: polymerase subunit gamma/tau [Candidatus Sumerlaeota bacterium]|nr:polymerase subunit gamma/tau [Candidatus Sumerlaeota bacterium]